MNLKTIFHWFYEKISNYNLFNREENDHYDDGDDNEPRNPQTVLQHQKYSTRLYVLLLIVSIYVLFYVTVINRKSRTTVISNNISELFDQLYLEHGETLLCPCSTITIPYETFVSNTIKFHPVCSSIFVSPEWVKALYLPDASKYGTGDFRTTASSQFQLLSSFCSLSKRTVVENQNDLNNNEFITVYLLSKAQVQSKVNATVQVFKRSLSTRIISFLNYLRIITRANFFVSALNTNAVLFIDYKEGQYVGYGTDVMYDPKRHYVILDENRLPCGNTNPISPASFLSVFYSRDRDAHVYWCKPNVSSTLVEGFFAGCTPLEAVLHSTLDCLYDIGCLQLLTNYFPDLKLMKLNFFNYVLSSNNKTNLSLYDHFNDLFVNEWLTEVNYSKYFHNCNPSSCTYTATNKINFSYGITLFISLYGGLIMILRLTVPFLINISMKLKYYLRNRNNDSIFNQIHARQYIQWIKRLNLFKVTNERTENDIKQQKIITHVYLVLLIGSFLVLCFFNLFDTKIVVTTVSNPSLTTYNDLQKLYSNNTLRCSCSTMAIGYEKFISLSPRLHQVCSSELLTEKWISMLKGHLGVDSSLDWRNKAHQQFQLLFDLCKLANTTINDAVKRFLLKSFIASNLPTEIDFNKQLKLILDQFFNSTVSYFDHLIGIVSLFIQVDQPYMAPLIPGGNFEVVLNLLSSQDIHSKLVNCICATNPHCKNLVAFFDTSVIIPLMVESRNHTVSYIIPGLIKGCSPIDSLLLSTLECFYSNSDCFSMIMSYLQETYLVNVHNSSWFDVLPLIYGSRLNEFLPNSTISMISKSIMVEQWNPSYSYDHFYELCAPSYCTYTERIRTKTVVGVIITLVSLLGGLVSALRLITPWLIKSVIWLVSKIFKKQGPQQQQQEQGQQQSVCLKWSIQLKTTMKNLPTNIYKISINLNVFMLRDFGNDVDRITAKRLGQWATRLYIVLFIISITILVLYGIIQPQTMKKIFDNPSLKFYNNLLKDYGDELKCPCSLISSTHDRFIKINPIFHQICLSSFVSDEWRINLTANLFPDLSIYERRDYRRFLSAHLQYLNGLCHFSMKLVNDSIDQFLSSLFISNELLSEIDFNKSINSSIEQSKSDASTLFNSLLFLIRNINHGNQIITTYGTNFEYIAPLNYQYLSHYLSSQAIIYDNECSCGLHRNCTTQASFLNRNPNKTVPIKGLKMGCTPSESFLSSTLECFYDISCINLIQEYTNYNVSFIPLSITKNRYTINTTVAKLIDHLFVDKWSTEMNYSSYFEQCAPSLCLYTYIKRFNILFTVALLFGLYDGLEIVFKWICPKIIEFVFKIYQYRKRRMNTVQPIDFRETTTVEMQLSTIQTNIIASVRCSFKVVVTFVLVMLLIVGLILFSIYIVRQKNKSVVITTTTTSTTVSISMGATTVSTSSTKTMSICKLQFQSISIFSPASDRKHRLSVVVDDFNNDNVLDLIYISRLDNKIYMLPGYGNGTFGKFIVSSIGSVLSLGDVTVGDFNRDNQLDIAFTDYSVDYMGIVFGSIDGTFGNIIIIPTKPVSGLKGINAADFNSDSYLDIIVMGFTIRNISVFLGNGDGSFSMQTTFYTGCDHYSSLIAINDLNGDHRLDIIVASFKDRYIAVFLGHGDGTFDVKKTSFTGLVLNPRYFAVGDFNNDTRQDVVVSYNSRRISVMFGYGNGTFGERIMITTESHLAGWPVVVIDFNKDGHLDIVFGESMPYRISILLGDGKGNFGMQTVFSNQNFDVGPFEIAVGDFKGDGYPDMIVIVRSINGDDVNLFLNKGVC